MNLRAKITLAVGAPALFCILLALFGAYQTHRVSEAGRAVMHANFRSLVYVQEMSAALTQMRPNDFRPYQIFEQNLQLESENVTETGEDRAVAALETDYKKLQAAEKQKDTAAYEATRLRLLSVTTEILKLNAAAMETKNNQANEVAHQAVRASLWALFFVGVLTPFLGWGLLRAILLPIKALTLRIRQTAEGDFSPLPFLRRNDEIGVLVTAYNKMVKQLEYFRNTNLAQILFEQKRGEIIMENLSDALLMLDENNTVIAANGLAERLLARHKNELLGQNAEDLAERHDLLRRWLQTEDGESNATLAVVVEGKTRRFTPLRLPITGIDPRDGIEKSFGRVLLMRDVTDFFERESAKTDRLASVGHELKTPIASLKLALRLLGDARVGTFNDEQSRLLAYLGEEIARLDGLTAEFLDWAKAEGGRLELQLQCVAPLPLAERSVAALALQAREKEIKFYLKDEAGLPEIKADPDKTVWILVNLIGNAVRYSPPGGTINVNLTKEGGFVVFSVVDNGPGIPPHELPRLFERYYRPADEQTKGHGLGLAIAAELARAMNGSLNVENQPENGACFSLRLPNFQTAKNIRNDK